jgi:hypothetical protein
VGSSRNAPIDFRGVRRSHETHRSSTHPDVMLYFKGPAMEPKLCFIEMHGLPKVDWAFVFTAAAYTLVRTKADRGHDVTALAGCELPQELPTPMPEIHCRYDLTSSCAGTAGVFRHSLDRTGGGETRCRKRGWNLAVGLQ